MEIRPQRQALQQTAHVCACQQEGGNTINKKVVVTKIARTPPSSSTSGRTRGPGLPVSKDAVNASWQIGILFSHICYEKKCAMKSKNPHRQQSTTLPCWWRYPVWSYQHKSTGLPLSLSTRLSETESAKVIFSPGHLGLPPVSLHQGASEYPRKESTLDRWRRRIARRLLRLA